jgi:hypothetical protein
LLLALSTAQAGALDAPARRTYLARVLDALAHSSAHELGQADATLRRAARDRCAAEVERFSVECLLFAGRAWCAQRDATRCLLSVDVLLGRLLAELRLVPLERRLELNDDPRAIADELRRLRAQLVLDFALHRRRGAHLATEIDGYCATAGHTGTLSWPACVAELAWAVRGATQ